MPRTHQGHVPQLRALGGAARYGDRAAERGFERYGVECWTAHLSSHYDTKLGFHDELRACGELRKKRADSRPHGVDWDADDVHGLIERMAQRTIVGNEETAA